MRSVLSTAPGARALGEPSQSPHDAATLREEALEHGLTAERALTLANELESEGRILQAVEMLTQANRMRRDVTLERRLVRLQRDAFAQLDRSLPPPAWPPFVPEDAPGTPQGPLVVKAGELTVGLLRTGILRHGCLLVRGLVPEQRAARLRDAIDHAFDAYDAVNIGLARPEMSAWFDPLEDVPGGYDKRLWGRMSQSVLTADSPRALFEFLETIREVGIDRLIAAYFGERPVLSVEKCMLRRTDERSQHSLWHQDGSFLGKGIRTVDAWFSLSPCGRDAPGMDIIPVRLERVLTPGGQGSGFDWTATADTIARELPGVMPWRPEFETGDVLFFDHFLLHRTAAAPGMKEERYAIESWFFAPSVYPETSTPLVV